MRLRFPWALRQIGVSTLLIAATLVGPPLLSLATRPDEPREAVVALVIGTAALAWQAHRARRAVLVVTDQEVRGDGAAIPRDQLVELFWQSADARDRSGGRVGVHRLHARSADHEVRLCRHPAGDAAAVRFSEVLREAGLPVTFLHLRGR